MSGRISQIKPASIYTRDVKFVMAASFFFMFSTMFVNPLINGYAKSLGASATFAGLIVGTMSLTAMFLRPSAGHLTDRLSYYTLSFIGGVLIAIGILGYVITPNAQLLIIFRIINGIGYVIDTVCMTTWLAALVPRAHVGEAMAFYGLMNALAMAVAPAISINVYHQLGYRHAIILPVISAVLTLVCIQFVHQRTTLQSRRNATSHSSSLQTQPASALHRTHHFRIIQPQAFPVLLLTALFAFPYFITQADIVTYTEQRGFHVAVGMYFFIYAALLLVMRLSLRRYFDTLAFGTWFWISLISSTLNLIFLTFMTNNWMMALAAATMAGGYGLIYSVLQATAMLLAPLNEQGLASATFYLGLDIAMSCGPIVGGVIDEFLPIRYFYIVQLVVIPLALIVYFIWRKRLDGAITRH